MAATASPFSPEQQSAFDAEAAKILPRYPEERRSAALIPLLMEAQRVLGGWLPPAALEHVGAVVGVPATRVREVATFYSLLHLEPVGQNHVQICTNLACWLMGSDKLVKVCKEKLGTRPYEPTADGKMSWCEVECLASCGTAPAARINEEYREGMTPEELEKELDALARK